MNHTIRFAEFHAIVESALKFDIGRDDELKQYIDINATFAAKGEWAFDALVAVYRFTRGGIRGLRQEMGFSQQKFADRFLLTPRGVQAIEYGDRCKVSTICLLLEASRMLPFDIE